MSEKPNPLRISCEPCIRSDLEKPVIQKMLADAHLLEQDAWKNQQSLWIAESDGKGPVGLCLTKQRADVLELLQIFVDERYRRRGVATKLAVNIPFRSYCQSGPKTVEATIRLQEESLYILNCLKKAGYESFLRENNMVVLRKTY